MENSEIYKRAKKRAAAKLGFYIHLGVYLLVITILVILNLTSGETYFWAKWPMFGWGIGVFWHAMGVYVFNGKSTIQERMIEKEMEKDVV